MSGKKLGRVPVLEDAFEINLAKLLAVSARTGQSLLAIGDGTNTGLVMIAPNHLTVFLGGATYILAITTVACLNGRARPLLLCSGAHEGNFQTLYWSGTEVACRHCLRLRYRSTLAPTATERARLARFKLLRKLGGTQDATMPARQPYKWRKRHARLAARCATLTLMDYAGIREWLARRASNK